MFKYLLSTFVLVFALSTAMAQNKADNPPSKKETTTVSKDAGTTQDISAKPASKGHSCKPGCKGKAKAECKGKSAKECKPGCEKACCAKTDAKHDHKHGEKHACAPGCTKACCADSKK